ncbi:MAG: glycoside hydrolase family 5 protein [Oscillospiraceae bacterium]|nr:glycoside hydrolase family 5 protein [Oscillospiraceae bacterium]
MLKKIKFLPFFTAICIAAAGLSGCNSASAANNKNQMRDITTAEVVQEMGLGINLGNTMESCGDWISPSGGVTAYETGWGSPVVTQPMIQGYADSGFGVLRVPVAWSNLMEENYTISPAYIARVKEIIGWALDADMYVIMNIHWDGGWFEGFGKDDKRDECFKKYESIWTQLSGEFKDYSDKLMFESLNEEGGWDEIWNRYSNQGDKEKSFGILNDMNQRFVNIVRGSGGNNEKRHLLIAGYGTDIDLTCDAAFKMPDDPAGRCAVSVHYYTPSTFAILERDASWGKARTEWGTDEDYAELNKYMDMMKTNFADKGIPVIIGEYGTSSSNKTPEMVRKYVTAVCGAAYERGLCPVLWDTTDHFYDRKEMKFIDPELLEGLMAVKEK